MEKFREPQVTEKDQPTTEAPTEEEPDLAKVETDEYEEDDLSYILNQLESLEKKDEEEKEENALPKQHSIETRSANEERHKQQQKDAAQLEHIRTNLTLQNIKERLEENNVPIHVRETDNKRVLTIGNKFYITEGAEDEFLQQSKAKYDIPETDKIASWDFTPEVAGTNIKRSQEDEKTKIQSKKSFFASMLKLAYEYNQEKDLKRKLQKKQELYRQLAAEQEDLEDLEDLEDTSHTSSDNFSTEADILSELKALNNERMYEFSRHMFGETNEQMAAYFKKHLGDAVDIIDSHEDPDLSAKEDYRRYNVHVDLDQLEDDNLLTHLHDRYQEIQRQEEEMT